MGHRRVLSVMLAACGSMAACHLALGLEDYGSGDGGAAAAGGEGGSGQGGSDGGSGAGGGSGMCGDGKIGGAEECDDANEEAGDGCDACQVECDGFNEYEQSVTHHCYLSVPDTYVPWSEASAACLTWGGTLAVVTSAVEQQFVAALAGDPPTWLGATDSGDDGVFTWVTGEDWSYDNWGVDQPDGAEAENCLGIDFQLNWSDEQCSDYNVYVCERPPPEAAP